MIEIDQVDERLIQLLGQDAQQSSQRLAAQLSVSVATAKRRLRRLLQSGAVRIFAIPDHYQIGLPVATVIGLKVDRRQNRRDSEKVRPKIRVPVGDNYHRQI